MSTSTDELVFISDISRAPKTVSITIGTRKMTATEPKAVFWLELFFLFERQEKADKAQQMINSGGSALAAATNGENISTEVQAAILNAPTGHEINEKLMSFLEASLPDKDVALLIGDLRSKTERRVDTGTVHEAAYGLYHAFRESFEQKFDEVNMDVSNSVNHKKPKAVTKPTK